MAIQQCSKCGAKNRVDERAAQMSQPVCGKCGTKLPSPASTAAANSKPQVVTDDTFARDVLAASSQTPVPGSAVELTVKVVLACGDMANGLVQPASLKAGDGRWLK